MKKQCFWLQIHLSSALIFRVSREEAFQARGVGLMMEVCTVEHEGRYSDEGRHSSTIFNTEDKKQPKYLDPSLDVSG